MNTISKAILGFVVIAVFACLWFLLTQRNKSSGGSDSFGCGGNCAGCGMKCSDRKDGNQNGNH